MSIETTEVRPGWLPFEEFPFRIRSVDLDRHPVRYVDEGEGPVLLFLHAGPTWMFVFRDLILRLREDFRCVALDVPGAGLSPARPGPPLELRPATTILESFVAALDLPPATVVAHDLGVPLSVLVSARHPGRFTGLVVAEGFAWPLQDENPKVARMLRPRVSVAT